MQGKDWNLDPQFNYFPNNPGNKATLHPTSSGSGWYFDIPVVTNFPSCLAGYGTLSYCYLVGYVLTPYSGPAQHQISMTFRIDVTGDPTFNYMGAQSPNNPSANAEVVFILQRRGDDLAHDLWRWYAIGDRVYLAPGEFTVTVPLTVDRWNNVNGSYSLAKRQAAFADVLANLGNVGVTFGGGCCADHGADVSNGTARFTMLDFSIN